MWRRALEELPRARRAVKGELQIGRSRTLERPRARGIIFTQVEAIKNSGCHLTVLECSGRLPIDSSLATRRRPDSINC